MLLSTGFSNMGEVEKDAPKFAKKHGKTLGFEPAAYTLNGPFCALPLAAERIGSFLCTSRGRSGLKERGGGPSTRCGNLSLWGMETK